MEKNLPLLNPDATAQSSFTNFRLPIGLPEKNYTIILIANIQNEYGQYAEKKMDVQVNLSDNSLMISWT